jgi:glycosyltransferase A (GT-A) superfamily protein (DUF2064 family)
MPLATFCKRTTKVCLINSDSPTLPRTILAEAIACLKKAGDRIVLGVSDGGPRAESQNAIGL